MCGAQKINSAQQAAFPDRQDSRLLLSYSVIREWGNNDAKNFHVRKSR